MTELRVDENDASAEFEAAAETAEGPVPDPPDFEPLLEHLRRDRGFDFHGYKRATLIRRIERRMQTIGIASFRDYLAHLESNPDEFPQLFNTILINVTAFFRDTEAWAYLSTEMLPRITSGKSYDAPIRAWSAGCASGEEPFSVAIALAEALGIEETLRRVKIYATDVDEEALAHGRQAVYSAKDIDGLAAPLVEKYFERNGNRYSFHKELRRCVIFGRHDLMQDAPISRIDLLVCRNTIMYFNAETQKRILSSLHFALNDGGVLFLGKAEMLLNHPNLFTPIDLKRRIFGAVPKGRIRERMLSLSRGVGDSTGGERLSERLRDATFDGGPIAQLVVDSTGSLACINERARTLFDLSVRDIGRPLRDLELSYKPVELRSCIDQVYADRRTMTLKEVEWPARLGEPQSFDVEVVPLVDGQTVLGVQISFIDVTQTKRLQKELRTASRELEAAYEEIQSTTEELETTNEELQSTVEELETTNEELQSTNEELETMNEELQSTNEELQTINGELQDRGGELNQVNGFLASILRSLDVGVVVLDRDLLVRVWNDKNVDLWGVRADEVLGKNFLNLDIGLPVGELRTPIRTCIAAEPRLADLVLSARNRRGKPLSCKISCTRLVDVAGETAGVILLIEEQLELSKGCQTAH